MLMIEDRLQAAQSHHAAGRNDSALMIYQGVLDINPLNQAALKGAGTLLLERGDVVAALPIAAQAALQGASDPAVLTMLAKAALSNGDEDRGRAAIEQALAIDPFDPEACLLESGFLGRSGETAAAEKLLLDALRRHPADILLLCALSQIYMDAGLSATALDFSRAALAQAPGNAECLALAGAQLGALGDFAEALKLMEQAHLLNPGNIAQMAYLADTYASLGQLTEAQRMAKRAIGLRPDFLPAWLAYVRVMVLRGGDVGASLAELAAVTRHHADKVEALITLASAYRLAGQPDQSLRLAQPLNARLKSLEAGQRSRVVALIRDGSLTLGRFEEVAASFSDVERRDATGAFGIADAADHEPAPAQARKAILIDRGLSTLDAMPLLRLPARAGPAEIHGPAAFGELVSLIPGACFHASDTPTDGTISAPIRTIPLSAALAVPDSIGVGIASAIPYMQAPADRRTLWRNSLRHLPRPWLAIAWDSSRPGLALEDLRPALQGFKGTLIGVAWDTGRQQMRAWPEVIDAAAHFASLADLAAVIAETDAILGPDGIALHLAGAMGHPGAVLTTPAQPWYWHDRAGMSVWYPSIAVLRTEDFGNWALKTLELRALIGPFMDRLHPPGRPPAEARI